MTPSTVMNFFKLDVYFNSLSLNTFLLKNKQLFFINYIYICFPRDTIQLLHGIIILGKVGKQLQLTFQLLLSKYFAGFIGFLKIFTEKF